MEDSADSHVARARICCEREEASARTHAQAADVKPMEWTDEKHSLYLKSMEATFVNHLYKLLAHQSQKNFPSGSNPSKHKPSGIRAPSGQYKVFRHGAWSKIDFMKENPEVNQMDESRVSLANPWIQHYRCSESKSNRKFSSSNVETAFVTTANQCSMHNFQLCSQDSTDRNTEVTDQNFNDEDLDEDKPSSIREIKRTRTSTDTVSSNDQVVPFENAIKIDNVVDQGCDEG